MGNNTGKYYTRKGTNAIYQCDEHHEKETMILHDIREEDKIIIEKGTPEWEEFQRLMTEAEATRRTKEKQKTSKKEKRNRE